MAAFFAYGDICHFNLTYPMGKKNAFDHIKTMNQEKREHNKWILFISDIKLITSLAINKTINCTSLFFARCRYTHGYMLISQTKNLHVPVSVLFDVVVR